MQYTPREYQKHIIDHILSHSRCAVYAGMGMGKTSATLYALDTLSLLAPIRALVIAPLRVASLTWPAEVRKWGLSLSVAVCCGSPEARRRAVNAHADITTINYENLPWLVNYLGASWPFSIIVADESTRLKSFRTGGKSVRARALSSVAWRYVTRFIELTGTPAPNGLLDLWGPMWFLDKGERLGKSFRLFTEVYFRQRRCGSSPYAVRYEPLKGAAEAIRRKTQDICVAVRPEDYFSLEAPVEVRVPVHLPESAEELYDTLCTRMLADTGDGESITAANAATLSGKLLQICAGAVYTDEGDGSFVEYHDEKIQALQSIISEANGEPVLVVYQWRSDAIRICRVIKEAVCLGKDLRVLDAWNAGKVPVLLVHPASAGHGLNLQDGGRILVIFSPWWDLEQYQQVIERIGPVRQYQSGHPRTVFIYHIVAEDTIDEDVIDRRQSKRKVQDYLLARLKK